ELAAVGIRGPKGQPDGLAREDHHVPEFLEHMARRDPRAFADRRAARAHGHRHGSSLRTGPAARHHASLSFRRRPVLARSGTAPGLCVHAHRPTRPRPEPGPRTPATASWWVRPTARATVCTAAGTRYAVSRRPAGL